MDESTIKRAEDGDDDGVEAHAVVAGRSLRGDGGDVGLKQVESDKL